MLLYSSRIIKIVTCCGGAFCVAFSWELALLQSVNIVWCLAFSYAKAWLLDVAMS